MTAPKCGSDVDIPAILSSQQNTRLEDAAPRAYRLPAKLVYPGRMLLQICELFLS